MALQVVPGCAGGPGGFPGGAPIGFSGPEEGPSREGSTNISFKALVHLHPQHIMNVKIMMCFFYIAMQYIQVIFFTFLIL